MIRRALLVSGRRSDRRPTRSIVRAVLLAVVLALLAPGVAAAGEPDPLEPSYEVDLQGSDGGFRWTGQITLSVVNPDLAPLHRIWVRLWGNGRQGCAARAVRITGVTGAVSGVDSVNCTALPLDLAVPLATGARGAVTLDVDIRVPGFVDRFGRGGPGLALLSNALPALAHREDGRWRLDRFFGAGEAWTYPAADWRVRLSPPAGVEVAAPGVLQQDGTRLLSRGRDYSWAAGRLRSLRRTVDGVAVTVWAPRSGPRGDLGRAMRLVQRRLPRLAQLFGRYGWSDLQVVLTDAAGMEHTAMVMTPAEDLTLTHELAHEWWFALIGDDQATAPWLDEGFATWAEAAARGRPVRCVGPRLARLMTRGVNFFRTRLFDYGAAVYGGGSCLLARLERRMGRARFRAALRSYALHHRYGWSTAQAFVAAMNAAAGSRPLGDLWRSYKLR